MKHPSAAPKISAFTLIELLVVIAIIAILAGLGLAGMNGALQSAKKAQARNDVNQLAAAIKGSQLEYGRLPIAGINGLDTAKADIVTVVSALTSSNTNNTRGIVFFEAKAAKEGTPPKGGLSVKDNKLYDPWGGVYEVNLDTSYDNKIANTTASGTNTTYLTTVVVVSGGPDTNISTATDNISNVK